MSSFKYINAGKSNSIARSTRSCCTNPSLDPFDRDFTRRRDVAIHTHTRFWVCVHYRFYIHSSIDQLDVEIISNPPSHAADYSVFAGNWADIQPGSHGEKLAA